LLSKRISAVFILLIMVELSLASIFRAYLYGLPFPEPSQGTPVERMETFLGEAVPFSRTLRSAMVELRYLLGFREQDGIFLTENRLIENIEEPVSSYVQSNTEALIHFAQQQSIPTYITLIPTASAILQNATPSFSDSRIYNQKQFIDERYKNFSGSLFCIDVYSALLQNNSQSLYFGTESLLSMQGGYFVYETVSRRMGNAPYGLDRFEISHLPQRYYGSLYHRVEFRNVEPDTISLFYYRGDSKEFSVVHHEETDKVYYTLFPTFLADLGSPLDVMLGGQSPVVDIEQQRKFNNSLLVFCDRQMFSVLPFLACDYRNIRALDLQQATEQQLQDIRISQYDEILFAYSVDTFMHSNAISRIKNGSWE
jgi:hypothetical protein